MIRRQSLAIGAYNTMTKLWAQRVRVSETRRLRLYNCYVKPILLYNAGTSALTAQEWAQLNAPNNQQPRPLRKMEISKPRANNKKRTLEIARTHAEDEQEK